MFESRQEEINFTGCKRVMGIRLAINLRLHACLPSNHVCSKFELPGSPQFLNQEPPRAQQLGLPDSVVLHLGHVAAGAPSIDDTGSRYD